MTDKPRLNLSGERELNKIEEQFNEFKDQVNELTHDRMRLVPKIDTEQQTRFAQQDMEKFPGLYIRPTNYVASKEKFNERFRKHYEYDKEYIQFIAENVELKGDMIEFWTKPYPGCPAEFWQLPVNKPIHAPRYVRDQLQRKFHHKLIMKASNGNENYMGSTSHGSYYGKIVVDEHVQRLDAREVSTRKQFSMSN